MISLNFVIGERCHELNTYVLLDYAYVIIIFVVLYCTGRINAVVAVRVLCSWS